MFIDILSIYSSKYTSELFYHDSKQHFSNSIINLETFTYITKSSIPSWKYSFCYYCVEVFIYTA